LFFISSANVLNKDINFGYIDCTNNYEECDKITNKVYPTIKYYSDGYEFPDLLFKEFKYDSILKWAENAKYTINKSIKISSTEFDNYKCVHYSPSSSSLTKAPLATILLILIHFLKY
jgi:hypothetical protein